MAAFYGASRIVLSTNANQGKLKWFHASNNGYLYRFKNDYKNSVRKFQRCKIGETSWTDIEFPGDSDVIMRLSSTTSFFYSPYEKTNQLFMARTDDHGTLKASSIELDDDVQVALPDQGRDGCVFYTKSPETFVVHYRRPGQTATEVPKVSNLIDYARFKFCLGYESALFWFTPSGELEPKLVINRLDISGNHTHSRVETPFLQTLIGKQLVPDGKGYLVAANESTLFVMDPNSLACHIEHLQRPVRIFGATPQGDLMATELRHDKTIVVNLFRTNRVISG